MTPLNTVVSTFEASAHPSVVKRCRALVKAGRARWIWDPAVENTVGLVRYDKPLAALVVVYDLGADFELSDELLAAC